MDIDMEATNSAIVKYAEFQNIKKASNFANESDWTQGGLWGGSSGNPPPSPAIEIPPKNSFLSWNSKLWIIYKLNVCKTPKQRMDALKSGSFNGNLDLTRLRELYHDNRITVEELVKASVYVLKNIATEEKAIMDLLREIFGLQFPSAFCNEVLAHCLVDPDLKTTPILIVDISEENVGNVNASNDSCTNPDPRFCRTVMAANSIEEMTRIFDHFFANDIVSDGDSTQEALYHTAQVFKKDINRNELELKIGKKTAKIYENLIDNNMATQEAFERVFNHLQKSEAEGGAELDGANAFYVLKQIALAYRGQNGTGDGSNLILLPLQKIVEFGLYVKFSQPKISMEFVNRNGLYNLVMKTENSSILGLEDIQGDGKCSSSEIRFKFSNDPEGKDIRTGLPIVSTRIPSTDGTIRWSCRFRENPPRKIIFYGGNKLAGVW
ncbi:MAG: hypothetical protein LBR92_03295 [Puniceicoccales bacterium]|jgi:hypothetical protein|nr:hypothetical protein [Puniceicoccales bacterium]